ncbi:hypothetical protein HAX54_006231 [Datura stramonium]|uniref:Ubiquitin-like protease family profile domain-containing protein n=1 Tax=Datura stramonium TaxID=4076 RepID=A0ABS8RUD9_DATST|nr:hypothetical protein [Datura stramonium]
MSWENVDKVLLPTCSVKEEIDGKKYILVVFDIDNSLKNTEEQAHDYLGKLPQAKKRYDCGHFVVKYADMLMNLENSVDFDSSTLHDYIKNWSINLSAHGYNKVKTYYQTPPDQIGDNYDRNNIMECN